MKTARARIQFSLLPQEDFLGIVGHELRTPLAGIKIFTQILERKIGQSKLANTYLSKIDRKVDTLVSLINDLVDIARLRHRELQLYYQFFSFDKLLEEIIKDLRLINKTHRIIKKGERVNEILADRSRIGQVISNLIKNAVKYSPEAKEVLVETSQDSGSVIVKVQDFGVGIPKELQKKIFEPFYRKNSITEREGGLGLGLYISSQIVRKHKGRIWVESEVGKGSSFFMALPRKPVGHEKKNYIDRK